MFVFRINLNNKPLFPVNPAFARRLLDNNEAFVFNNSPFIIKMNHKIPYKKNKLTLYVNVTFDGIEFVVVSNKGEIFFSKVLKSDSFSGDLEGLFLYIHEVLPITNSYFMINENAIDFIDIVHNKTFTFKDFKSDFSSIMKRNECVYCRRQLDLENYKILKIKKDFNFYGNSILVCQKCSSRYSDKEENSYIKLINYLFDIEQYIYDFYKENILKLKENKGEQNV